MKRAKTALLLAGLAAGAAGPAWAQSDIAPIWERALPVQPGFGPGATDVLGDVILGPINTGTLVGGQRLLGVEHAWGHLWVSGGTAAAAGQQRIWKVTTGGALAGTFNQVTNSPAANFWGGRDGAADEANNKLYFGAENGELSEYTFDPSTGTISHTTLHSIAGAGTIRALVLSPTNGHFFCADFGGPIFEFTIAPAAVVNTYPNPGLALYGLSYDDINNTIWAFSQNITAATTGSAANNHHLVKVTELDAVTFVPTGRSFDGAPQPGCVPTSTTACDIAGGADIFCDSQGRLVMVTMHQAPSDTVVGYDLDEACGNPCYPDCNNSGTLTIADFGCFQAAFAAGDPYADCNNSGTLTIADFGCFQAAFAAGCP